jgi:hypothetical protein
MERVRLPEPFDNSIPVIQAILACRHHILREMEFPGGTQFGRSRSQDGFPGGQGEVCQKAKICKNKRKGKDAQNHIRRRKTAEVSQRKIGKTLSESRRCLSFQETERWAKAHRKIKMAQQYNN